MICENYTVPISFKKMASDRNDPFLLKWVLTMFFVERYNDIE